MTQVAVRPEQRPQRRPRQHRRAPWVAVMLLVALAVTLAGIFPFRQMIAQDRQVENTQAKLDALLDENAQLERQIEALNTEAEVERLARESGLVRPGETSYAVEPSDDVLPASPAPLDPDRLDDRSLLERFWDFLTGRDLVPDE